MTRILEPELLDHLPPNDSRAVRSRADLRRLNKLMRHAPLFTVTLLKNFPQPPKRIADIGAGDGMLSLQIATRTSWRGVQLVLIDQQNVVSAPTLARFQEMDWRVEIVTGDVFDWAAKTPTMDCVIANLFLHHFSDEKLSSLFRVLAPKATVFIACETRRSALAIAMSRLVGLIGCNSVTRHDAVLSMKSGFSDRELSSLWPTRADWNLEEKCAMMVTHLFVASRKSGDSSGALEYDI